MLARAKRDHYAVLGVSPDADRDSIKRAFRTLAATYHPDISGEQDAEERFREIAEAYEVLSRPESRARYDRRGSPAREGGGRRRARFGAGDVRVRHVDFGSLRVRPGEPGADVVVDARVSFVDAARGTSRSLRYEPLVSCPECGGEGRSGSVACALCRGLGRVEDERLLLIRIPAGVLDGQEIRFRGEGHAGGSRAVPGDVVVTIHVDQAPDHALVRRLAAAGVACALGLAVLTVVLH